MIRILFCLALGALLCTCASRPDHVMSSTADERYNKNTVKRESIGEPVDLSGYLQRISGVAVHGNGAQAQVRIRGPVSFQSHSNNPLFVVNGARIGHDYGQVYSAINVRDIDRVRVLKGADETAIYGVSGAAGVVEIYLRD